MAEVFGPDRADVAFECVGLAETANQAIRCVRKGGTVIVVGVFGDRPSIDLGLVQDRELELRGTLMYQRQDYVDAIRCLAEGGITVAPLLTKSFSFRHYPEAYTFIEENRENGDEGHDRSGRVGRKLNLPHPSPCRPSRAQVGA